MKSKKLSLFLNLIAVLAIAFGVAAACLNVNVSDIAYAATSMSDSAESWSQIYDGTYYDGINASKTGSALRSDVASLITSTHKTMTTYSGLANAFKVADADPDKSGNIIWFYTGTSVSFKSFGGTSGATNREHVWPKNSGNAFPAESGPGSDAHHLRPTETNLNSTRGSKSFGEVAKTSSNAVKENGSTGYGVSGDPDTLCYTSGSFFYPAKGYRGATARILFYLQTRWGDQYNLTFVDSAGSNKTIGKISTLLKWHLEEPPTDEEIRRNDAVFKLQGNRNPFIDHPEYAAAIYCNDGKSYNNALKQVVETYGDYNSDRPELEGLSININSLTLIAGATQTLSVTAYPTGASAKVNWTSSNTDVATVNNGVVTAKADGTAVITAASADNPSISVSATVRVKVAKSIEIVGEPTKKVYEVGQTFDPQGLTVKLIYSDDSAETFSSPSDLAKFSWVDANNGQTQMSDSTANIKCKYGNIEATSSWSITMKAVTSIALLGSPATQVYQAGQSFNPQGLTVRLTYNDNTTRDVTSLNELLQFDWVDSVTGSKVLTESTSRITVKYQGFSQESSWTVVVLAPPDTVANFINSVMAIGSKSNLQDRFTAIKTAISEYGKLSDTDKNNSGVKEAYQTLQQEISDYNDDIASQNAIMSEATKTGAYAICGVTLAAVALIAVLDRKFN